MLVDPGCVVLHKPMTMIILMMTMMMMMMYVCMYGVEVDECTDGAGGAAACGNNADCVNTPPGAHTCQCKPGYYELPSGCQGTCTPSLYSILSHDPVSQFVSLGEII